LDELVGGGEGVVDIEVVESNGRPVDIGDLDAEAQHAERPTDRIFSVEGG
jgi:hypothetical protein